MCYFQQAKGVVNTAVSAAVQAVRGRGRGTLTRGAFVGATAAPGYIAPGIVQPERCLPPFSGPQFPRIASLFSRVTEGFWKHNTGIGCVCTEI